MVAGVYVHECDEMMLMGQLVVYSPYCAHMVIPKDLCCFGASPACSLGWARGSQERASGAPETLLRDAEMTSQRREHSLDALFWAAFTSGTLGTFRAGLVRNALEDNLRLAQIVSTIKFSKKRLFTWAIV